MDNIQNKKKPNNPPYKVAAPGKESKQEVKCSFYALPAGADQWETAIHVSMLPNFTYIQ